MFLVGNVGVAWFFGIGIFSRLVMLMSFIVRLVVIWESYLMVSDKLIHFAVSTSIRRLGDVV